MDNQSQFPQMPLRDETPPENRKLLDAMERRASPKAAPGGWDVPEGDGGGASPCTHPECGCIESTSIWCRKAPQHPLNRIKHLEGERSRLEARAEAALAASRAEVEQWKVDYEEMRRDEAASRARADALAGALEELLEAAGIDDDPEENSPELNNAAISARAALAAHAGSKGGEG